MRLGLCTLLALTGCSLGLEVPEDVVVLCASDADCRSGQVCAPAGTCVDEIAGGSLALRAANAADERTVILTFDQALVKSIAREVQHYTVAPALGVVDAFANTDTTVTLRTDEQLAGVVYTVSVAGLAGVNGSVVSADTASATFEGFGTADDTSPPDAISPTRNALVTNLATTLVWSARRGATFYSVAVSRNPTCAEPVSTFDVAAPATNLAITLPGLGEWHWCVSADITAGSARSHAAFHATDDSIHVYCDDDACASGASEVGSPDAPLRSINRGITLARSRGLERLRIAARPAGAAYEELIQIVGHVVNLEGGYDASFTSRDVTGAQAFVRYRTSVLFIGDTPGAVSISGMRFLARDAYETVALMARRIEGGLTLRDCRLESEGAWTAISALMDVDSDPLFERTQIIASASARTIGIDATATSVHVVDSIVRVRAATDESVALRSGASLDVHGSIVSAASAATDTAGIRADGELAITDNTISVGMPGMPSSDHATGIDVMRTGHGAIARNRIFVAQPSYRASGVLVRTVEPLMVRDNVIAASGSTGAGIHVKLDEPLYPCSDDHPLAFIGNTVYASQYALWLENGGHPTVTNNIFSAPSTNVGTCVREELPNPGRGNDVDVLSFQNNVLLGCNNPYVEARRAVPSGAWSQLNHTTNAAVDGQNGSACNTDPTTHVRYSGNIVSAQTIAEVFVDSDGADNLLFDLTDDAVYECRDNDYSLLLSADPHGIATNGKDPSASDCGSQESPTACNGSSRDFADAPRTAPFSIGAYEKDVMAP